MVDIAKVESDGIYHRLEVTFNPAEIATCRSEVLAKLAKQVQIPGFRSGKAPANLVAKRYEKQMQQDILAALRERTINEVLENSGMEVFALESIGIPDYEPDSPLKFLVILDEKPQFELPDYIGKIVLSKEEIIVSEAEIQKAYNALLRQKSTFNVVDRPAQKGDSVKVAYLGREADGTPLMETHPDLRIWAQQDGVWEEAGVPNEFGISAITDGVLGMKTGEKKTISMTFPKDFKISALAGKTIHYECEILEVRERILPAMDAAFWKELGVENAAQFHEKIRQYLEQNQIQESKLRQREAIVAFLQANIHFPIPKGALEQEMDYILRHLMQANLNRGISREELEKHRQEWVSMAEKNAKEKIFMAIVIDAIAAKENIQLKDSDLNQLIFQEALLNRCEPREIVAKLQKDYHAIKDLRQRGLAIKTIDFILHSLTCEANCHCQICDKKAPEMTADNSEENLDKKLPENFEKKSDEKSEENSPEKLRADSGEKLEGKSEKNVEKISEMDSKIVTKNENGPEMPNLTAEKSQITAKSRNTVKAKSKKE